MVGHRLVWLVTSCPRTQTNGNGAFFEESYSFRKEGEKSTMHVFDQVKKKKSFSQDRYEIKKRVGTRQSVPSLIQTSQATFASTPFLLSRPQTGKSGC